MRALLHFFRTLFKPPEYRIEEDSQTIQLICKDCNLLVESWPSGTITEDEVWAIVRAARAEAYKRY